MTTANVQTSTFPAWVLAALSGSATVAPQTAQDAQPGEAVPTTIESAAPVLAPAKRSRKGKGKRAEVATADLETVTNPASIDLPSLECHSLPDLSGDADNLSLSVDSLT
jgi:hypothetical protein